MFSFAGPLQWSPGLAAHWRDRLRETLEVELRFEVASPTYSDGMPFDTKGYWMRPRTPKRAEWVKQLRKHSLTSLVSLLGQVERHRPRMLVGSGKEGS